MAELPAPTPADPAVSAPLVPPPNQPTPQDPAAPQVHIGQQPALNWSHFRPEYSGKPEEDAEAHLLCTNGWMNIHNFLRRCKSTKILFNIGWRGEIVV